MIVNTSRFGSVTIKPSQVITFPEGVLGFYDLRRFAIIKPEEEQVFSFLQSLESEHICFPLVPQDNTPNDMTGFIKLGLNLWSIVTIPDDPTLMTANEKAPIVINGKKGAQLVSRDQDMIIRTPIFSKLQAKFFPEKGLSND